MFPKLFDVGPITVYSYGVLIALGFLIAILWPANLAKKEGMQDATKIEGLGLVIILASLVGSKLFDAIDYWGYYSADWNQYLRVHVLGRGGVFYGGFLFACAGSAIYLRLVGLPGWQLADCVAPGLALAQGLGRVGCFLAGCCWGIPTQFPLQVSFTSPLANKISGVPLNVGLHPTQLYEAALVLAAVPLTLLIKRRKSFHGQVMLAYVMFYAVARFFLEFLRGDPRGFLFGGLISTSQFIGLLILPVAAALMFHLRRKNEKASIARDPILSM